MSTPAISQTLWQAMVEDNLFDPVMEKIRGALRDDSAFANSDTVVIPNAGSPAGITAGNNVYPVPINQRTDQPNFYTLTNLEVEPILIQFKEQQVISYNKVESILKDQLLGLSQRAGRVIVHGHYHTNADSRVLTSGDAVAAHAPSATSTRKAIKYADVVSAAEKMDRQLMPRDGRYLLIDTVMYYQLLQEMGFNANRDAIAVNLGITLPPIAGFTPVLLNDVVYVASNYTARAIGHAGATTDQAVALAVQTGGTSYAMSPVQAYANTGKAEYYGDVYSATVWLGGKYRRLDFKGVVPIIQANS